MKPETIHIGDCIRRELNRQGMSVADLAAQLGIERPNCYRILRRPNIPTDRLYLVSQILHYDFFALYSKELQLNDTNINSNTI